MTEKEVLEEIYDELMNKVFVRSGNYLMTKPKRGCEDEFRHYSDMAEVIGGLMKRLSLEAVPTGRIGGTAV